MHVCTWVVTAWRLIARRAWVGTLGLVILWCLLDLHQSRDLLFGIGQMLWAGKAGQLAPDLRYFGWILYVCFWVSALVLAATFGVAVRVTGFDPSRQAPASADPAEPNPSLIHPRLIYPRLMMIAALALAHYAYIREQPFADGLRAWVFMLFALVPTVVFPLLSREIAPWIRAAVQVLVLVVAVIAVFPRGFGSEWTTAILISIATPALISWLPWPDWTDVDWRVTLFVTAVLLFILLFAPLPAAIPYTIGSVPIAFVAFSFAIAALAAMAFVLAFYRLDPLFAVVVLLIVLWQFPERLGNERLADVPAPPACQQGASCVQVSAANLGQPPAIGIALHADGGGIRAAFFTAQVLALADDMTCGEFGRYLFAASGVSGGALGIATWAAVRQDYLLENADKAWADCKELRDTPPVSGGTMGQLTSLPLTYRVEYSLAQDHLAGALAAMLTWDRIPFGWASRGQALVQSWQDTATLAATPTTPAPAPARMAFARLLKDTTAGVEPAPRLYFSSTNADNGERVVFSNRDLPPDDYHQGLQLGVAALNSARFPVISPPGLSYDAARGTWIRVVDGGYFDNSGAATLLDALRRVPREALPKKLVIVRINGNAAESPGTCETFLAKQNMAPAPGPADAMMGEPVDHARGRLEKERWSGIRAYRSVRTAHAEEAVRTLHEALGAATDGGLPAGNTLELRLDYDAYVNTACEGADKASCV